MIANIKILAIVALIIILIIRKMITDKKNGKSACRYIFELL